jgi:hypothetical protein
MRSLAVAREVGHLFRLVSARRSCGRLLQLHALAYNLGNFMRTLATPEAIKDWTLTSLREKLIKIGAKVVSHGRYVTFQMAEVAIPRDIFAQLLQRITDLRSPPAPAPTSDTLRSSWRCLTTGNLRPNERKAGLLGTWWVENRIHNRERPRAKAHASPIEPEEGIRAPNCFAIWCIRA